MMVVGRRDQAQEGNAQCFAGCRKTPTSFILRADICLWGEVFPSLALLLLQENSPAQVVAFNVIEFILHHLGKGKQVLD